MKDALVPLFFRILSEHVQRAKGHKHDPYWCVVAQALRKVKGIVDAKVYKTYTVVTFSSGKMVRYRTPFALAESLTYWDRMGEWKIVPGTYCLEVPSPSQTVKARRKYAKRAKVRIIKGNYTYVYGPRGPQKKTRAVNARNFFGCFRRTAA